MPRLGELLVASGLLTVEQVERALRAQVLWGGRLGTNIVELHFLELDPLSRALARQFQRPAALARHFEKADPALQRLLSPDFAERFSCVPLLRMGPEGHVVVASLAPLLPRQLAIIADELGVEVNRLVPAIAAELRIRYQLERVYNIPRAARFLRARGKSIPPFPAFQVLVVQPEPELPSLPVSTREMAVFRPAVVPDPASPVPAPPPAAQPPPPPAIILELDPDESSPADSWPTEPWPAVPVAAPDPGELDPPDRGDDEGSGLLPVEVIAPGHALGELDDLTREVTLDDDTGGPGRLEDDRTGRERRQYVRTIADPSPDSERQALIGRIAIRKVAVGSAPRVMAGATLGEATRAIRRSTGRDRVAELVIDTLERFAPGCEAAIMLVIRGATAIGWKGFVRSGGGLAEIAVPMEDGGLVPRAVELNVTLRKPSAELDRIDRLLLGSLGGHDGDLVVVPISVADQVLCVIAIATGLDAPIASAEPIAAAAGAAFARLMRDASR
jgi:Type II secretion system (T2SS), protein E, N-terminal domain